MMNLAAMQETETQARSDPLPLLLDVQNVSKLYHLWESPRARLIYGLWSQVPPWAPMRLREFAQGRKAKLGRDFYALHNVSLELREGESVCYSWTQRQWQKHAAPDCFWHTATERRNCKPALPKDISAARIGEWV